MPNAAPNLKPKKLVSRSGGLFWIMLTVLILAGLGTAAGGYTHKYRGFIFPGVKIGALEVGGKTPEEARVMLDKTIDDLLSQGFDFVLANQKTTVSPLVLSLKDPDTARELVSFDRAAAIKNALAIGRGQNPLHNLFVQLKARFQGVNIPVSIFISFDDIEQTIIESFPNNLIAAADAKLSTNWSEEHQPVVTILPEIVGMTFNVPKVKAKLITALSALQHPIIDLETLTYKPNIMAEEAEPFIQKVNQFLKDGPWTLQFESNEWSLDAKKISELLVLQKNKNNQIELIFGDSGLTELFSEIGRVINRPPQNAKFAMKGNRVIEFQGSRDGITLDKDRTAALMTNQFMVENQNKLEVATVIRAPEITTAEINDLGIEAVLGIGTSNFKGSPTNRKKNIKNGAKLVNGTLVDPDEEFSLLAALGPFTTDNGYLPELVIKGDKIKPEIGGGLCQLGTTTFRATMNSGLPVTSRQNHSLVVSYYNDPSNGNPGTDATIYEPRPDFRFKNDTGAHLLITTEVDESKNELRFIFWGKPDGRKGYYSPPVVERWIPPGETVRVETTDLEPGKEQCEKKHVGADTRFTYTIERPRGETEETIYESHYRALPEICLIGVPKIEEQKNETILENFTPTETAGLQPAI